MLFMHETHKVIGRHAALFEELYRTEWRGPWLRAAMPGWSGI